MTIKTRWFERVAARLESCGRRRILGLKQLEYGGRRMIPRLVDGKEAPYLERFYVLSTPIFGVYLHRFWASDDDGLHDHPWHSISFLLTGLYFEEEPERQSVPQGATINRKRRPFRPVCKFRSKYAAHRITVPEGAEGDCWTLFIRFGLKRRTWGFYAEQAWQPAEKQSRRDA